VLALTRATIVIAEREARYLVASHGRAEASAKSNEQCFLLRCTSPDLARSGRPRMIAKCLLFGGEADLLNLSSSGCDPGCVKTPCGCYDSPVILLGESMRRFVEEADRGQWTLLPECLDDFIDESNPVRAIDAFVDALDLAEMSLGPGRSGPDGVKSP
jgi:hypothetical protein